jgi:hypothetical protein
LISWSTLPILHEKSGISGPSTRIRIFLIYLDKITTKTIANG